MELEYQKHKVFIRKDKYVDGDNTAIQLIDSQGLPFITATFNIPEINLKENEVFIKNWSENEGILSWLKDNGIVTDVVGKVPTGMVAAPICKVNLNRLDKLAVNI